MKFVGVERVSQKYDYGVITYKHRFSIKRSLDDYEDITLCNVIRIGVELKYKTVACDKLVYELQILYRDINFEIQCLKLDLHDWTFTINHLGEMMVNV
ncbi:MAG: hypothetical protein J6C46_12275 [Clostridia bacterium]|nr:hypothetical protein [Clostridia bacterium]